MQDKEFQFVKKLEAEIKEQDYFLTLSEIKTEHGQTEVTLKFVCQG